MDCPPPKNGRCGEVAVSGGSTVPLLKHFPFLFLLRVVAILENKANSESQRVPSSFKFIVLPQYKT